jgi:hypothetical protein
MHSSASRAAALLMIVQSAKISTAISLSVRISFPVLATHLSSTAALGVVCPTTFGHGTEFHQCHSCNNSLCCGRNTTNCPESRCLVLRHHRCSNSTASLCCCYSLCSRYHSCCSYFHFGCRKCSHHTLGTYRAPALCQQGQQLAVMAQ